MANKTASNRKPITSGTKGLICLIVLCAVLAFVSCISLVGMPLDSEGVNILLPWVPVSSANWPASLPLNRALGGGTYTDYNYTAAEGVSVDDSVKTIKSRLVALGEADAAVSLKGDAIRAELRKLSASQRASELAMATMPAHFEFTDSNGTVVLTEKDVANAKYAAKSSGSTYTVSMDFNLTKEGAQKLKEANPSYLAITCDGDSVSSFASVGDGKVTASLGTGDSAYRAAANYAFLANNGAVDVTLSQSGTGDVPASSGIVLTVVMLLCAALLVCALIYLVMIGKLTGVSAFIAVWCTVLMTLFFVATVVVPSSYMINVGMLVAMLLGVLLSMYAAVNRTAAISKQIGEGSAPKQATKLGMKNAAKTIWLAHGAAMVVALLLMIFSFSRSIGYALCVSVIASALSTLVMRAFQFCFTAMTNKPALFGKVK
ncbi:MAG: hypothetical protein IKH57_14775 [Clostridia bacterium]|nr:hypothetical protein [Clostridia bacterium]